MTGNECYREKYGIRHSFFSGRREVHSRKEHGMEHQTGLEEAYVIKENKRLRMGYTTGSCAAAAAKAAAQMLLSGRQVEEAALMTPKGILLHLLIEEIHMAYDVSGSVTEVRCAVRKDGGDDPDVTHGALIFATVSRQEQGITIDGGKGVGRVTKPGLAQPVGEAAINPIPRRMILEETRKVCESHEYTGGLKVIISIPKGEELAGKTFNPRLGIVGGISVLGTSGIVVPMSEDALIASIRLEMQMLVAGGARYLLITPGNYGAAFAAGMPKLKRSAEMKCSNYVGETLDMAVELGVKGILFIAHIGKFIKVSGGIMNTHSRNADSRAELMAAAYLRAGGDTKVAGRILDTLTTEEALDLLEEAGGNMLDRTMQQVCEKVEFYLQNRCRGQMETGTILFSQVKGKLGETSNVPDLIRKINGEE
jgi:cobalt-precorrin-5B (C1)-methyltransferase